jgi:hypothetical protein
MLAMCTDPPKTNLKAIIGIVFAYFFVVYIGLSLAAAGNVGWWVSRVALLAGIVGIIALLGFAIRAIVRRDRSVPR